MNVWTCHGKEEARSIGGLALPVFLSSTRVEGMGTKAFGLAEKGGQ